MDVLSVVVGVGLSLCVCLLFGYLADPGRHSRDYDRAMQKDLEYHRTHPDCTWEEAHREREKVYRKRGL